MITCEALQTMTKKFNNKLKSITLEKDDEACATIFRSRGKHYLTALAKGKLGKCTPPEPPKATTGVGSVHTHPPTDKLDFSFQDYLMALGKRWEGMCVVIGDKKHCQFVDTTVYDDPVKTPDEKIKHVKDTARDCLEKEH